MTLQVTLFSFNFIQVRYNVRYNVNLFTIFWQERLKNNDEIAMIRPVYVEFESVKLAWSVFDQFMFGQDILVAPVLEAGLIRRSVYLFGLNNTWIHIWTRQEYFLELQDYMLIEVDSPIGQIPVFVLKDSKSSQTLLDKIDEVYIV